ncbi:MAG TPA: TfoX/Sxy family protein [Candidatus Saccharimonadales bacterium]
MAYDTKLEERIDKLTAEWRLKKKNMFGGLSYLVNGNMSVGIVKNEMIIRTSPEKEVKMLEKAGIRPMDFTGRPIKGWLSAAPEAFDTDNKLEELIDCGITFAQSLPPKKKQ